MRPAIEVTDADREAVHAWMREQSTGLQMMMTKPRGLYEAFARHRLAEREAVVKWLREEARMARIRRPDPDAALQAFADGLANGADAIEAGEHRK